jgi:UTP--glucose-1-phosphate uridylyltransferase
VTKANPKEMLPIVDRPLIQFAVEEAVAAGIRDLIFVTSSSKQSIEDYFDSNYELEARLAQQGKEPLLAIIRDILPPGVNCIYVRQPEPRGLGDAVLRAQSIIGNEPFAVLLADDLLDCPEEGCLAQMCKVYQDTQCSVVAVEPIIPAQTKYYGVISYGEQHANRYQIKGIIEKPAAADAPSNLGVAGRYILTPSVFSCLTQVAAGANGELQLTDGIGHMLRKQAVYALQFVGKRYDCGSKLGYLKATVRQGLRHPELAKEFREYLFEVLEVD